MPSKKDIVFNAVSRLVDFYTSTRWSCFLICQNSNEKYLYLIETLVITLHYLSNYFTYPKHNGIINPDMCLLLVLGQMHFKNKPFVISVNGL